MLKTAVIAVVFLGAAPTAVDTKTRLREHCLLYAADPKNPWGLAHGITGLGATFVAGDGRLAADVIVSDFAQVTDGGVAFQKFAADGTPIEPHPTLQAKTLLQAGLPLTRKFKIGKSELTLKDLVESTKRSFVHRASDEVYWQHIGWTLDVFSMTLKPGDTFVGADGGTVSIDRVMDDAMNKLEESTRELKAGLEQHLPQVDKRKQGLYGHPCGGLHFEQAVLSWARFPQVRKAWGTRVDDQIAVLFYRLESERRQYDAALQQNPQFALQVLVQMVKFYGHFLETTARLKADLKWTPSTLQRNDISKAKALLDAAVKELDRRGAFSSMEQLKTSQRQIYLDLIGDSCHAAHGLAGWN